jgi:pimeloyl-ACP methyl ester carboxylesterase
MMEIISEGAIMSSLAGVRDPSAAFTRAYEDALACWPVPVTSARVPTDYGTTHVLASGPADGAPVLLLPGGSATVLAWRAVAGGLTRTHRVLAVDPVGQPGLSVPGSSRLRSAADVTRWLDQVLDGLGITCAALAGHSYGAWLALRYALDAPGRVSRLVLLDPTFCFASLSQRYRLHAIPLLVRPSAARMRRFLAWETRGRPLDEAWLSVAAAGHDLGRAQIVMPQLPRASELAALQVPVLILVAGASQAHDPRRMAERARGRLPGATVVTVPGATHHTIPTEDAGQLLRHIEPFLAG